MAEGAMHNPLLCEEESHSKLSDPPEYNVVVTEKTRENLALNNIPGKPGQRILNAEMPQIRLPDGSTQTPNVNIIMPGPTILPVGPKGMRMKCYHCGVDIMTTTEKSNTPSAHLACYLLCFATCCCCWIPYCMDTFKKVDHKCPGCRGYLGSYNV